MSNHRNHEVRSRRRTLRRVGGDGAGGLPAVCGRTAEGVQGRGRDGNAPPGKVARRGGAGQVGDGLVGGFVVEQAFSDAGG